MSGGKRLYNMLDEPNPIYERYHERKRPIDDFLTDCCDVSSVNAETYLKDLFCEYDIWCTVKIKKK